MGYKNGALEGPSSESHDPLPRQPSEGPQKGRPLHLPIASPHPSETGKQGPERRSHSPQVTQHPSQADQFSQLSPVSSWTHVHLECHDVALFTEQLLQISCRALAHSSLMTTLLDGHCCCPSYTFSGN